MILVDVGIWVLLAIIGVCGGMAFARWIARHFLPPRYHRFPGHPESADSGQLDEARRIRLRSQRVRSHAGRYSDDDFDDAFNLAAEKEEEDLGSNGD